ncbi:hypothetical protein EV401DRAFT_1906728 [Pisolithus croceorrhizus]|nr:hypothetical protein EV401DRAFT_1906728 [Pisolithus croceorrhizus]
MIDKRFFRHATTHRHIVVVYECQRRFNQQSAQDMIARFVQRCRDFGESYLLSFNGKRSALRNEG